MVNADKARPTKAPVEAPTAIGTVDEASPIARPVKAERAEKVIVTPMDLPIKA